MGFDLSGVNPKIHKNTSHYKYYDNDRDLCKS